MAGPHDAGGFLDELLEATNLKYVFLAALLEKFVPFLPSYVIFPAMGMAAAGAPELWLHCLVAVLGSVGGASCWYVLGALVGPARVRQLIARHGRWFLLNLSLYDRIVSSYRGRPFLLTLVGQMIPTVRILQALPAGVLQLPLPAFLVATGVGAFCWIMPLAVAGHVVRAWGWTAAEAGSGLLAVLVVTEGIALFTFRRRLVDLAVKDTRP